MYAQQPKNKLRSFDEAQEQVENSINMLMSDPHWLLQPAQREALQRCLNEVIETKAFLKLNADNLTASAIEDSWLGGQLHVLTALLHDADLNLQRLSTNEA